MITESKIDYIRNPTKLSDFNREIRTKLNEYELTAQLNHAIDGTVTQLMVYFCGHTVTMDGELYVVFGLKENDQGQLVIDRMKLSPIENSLNNRHSKNTGFLQITVLFETQRVKIKSKLELEKEKKIKKLMQNIQNL